PLTGRKDRPLDGLADPDRLREGHDCLPASARLVAKDENPSMLSAIGVDDRVEIIDAELSPELLYIVLFPGEEVPARAHAIGFRVSAEHIGSVVLGIERDRQEGDVTPGPLAEELLDLNELRGRQWTGDLAPREHEVDRDDLTLHEVVVEPHRSAFVGRELGVGQMFPADGFDPVRRMRGGGRWRRSHRRGYRTTVRT